MKIEDIVPNLELPVDFYAKAIYNWDKHNQDEAQTTTDINKEKGFIKIFSDELGNKAYVLKSKNPVVINPTIITGFTPKTQVLLQELLKKEFYFIGLIARDETMEDITFPNDIYTSLDDAIKGATKYLLQNN